MKRKNEVPTWLGIVIWFYIGFNVLLGAFFVISPMIVIEPGNTVLGVKMRFAGLFLLKIFGAIMVKNKGMTSLPLFALACVFGTWLEWPFFWVNFTTKLLTLDWVILILASYFLFAVRERQL